MKHIRLFVLVGLFLALIAVSPGCAPAAKPMEAEADFYGFITEIHPDREGDILGQISRIAFRQNRQQVHRHCNRRNADFSAGRG